MSDSFFNKIDQVDQILARGPQRCDYDADLKELLKDREVEEYFYSHAESPAWLQILTAADKIGPDTSSGKWPASPYLKKIASIKPKEVSEILCEATDTTDASLIAKICDVAQELPTGESERILEAAVQWAALPSVKGFARQLVPLIPKWAAGSKVKELQELVNKLLRLESETSEENQYLFSPSLATEPRIGNWLYERLLKEQIPKVYQADALGTLDLLTDVLHKAIEAGREQRDRTKDIWPDASQSWRPAIENHGQNEPEDLIDALVAAVRDYHEQAINSDKLSLSEAVTGLESRRWALFVRIGLHLARKFGSEDRGIIRERLTDTSLFHSPACHHEFYLLLQDCFPLLETEDRQFVLRMIDEEVSREEARTFLEKREDEVTDEAVEKFIGARKLKWLSAIADHLSGARRKEYDALLEEIGQPDHPEFLIYRSGVQTGFVSPESPASLAERPADKLIEFLSEWTPPEEQGIDAPSREGLANEIQNLVATNPENYVEIAAEFSDLPDVYTRGFVDGLVRAAEDEKTLEWADLLTLFEALVESHPPGEYGALRTEDRGIARSLLSSVARFIDEALKHPATSPSIEHRNGVWEILAGLMRFPDPAFNQPKPEDEESFDPVFRAINSVRGRAFYALMRYAAWLNRNLEDPKGFTTAPELGEVLDWHLDLANDASLAIRGAYGTWVPWLYHFDASWLKARIHKIFPEEESLQEYWWSAWEGFVSYTPARGRLFELLEDQYRKAVHNLDEAKERSEGHSSDIAKRTAHHIVAFYWQGVLEGANSDLLRTFYINAPTDLRAESIRFAGRSLRSSDETVPPEVLQRLESLWRWRLDERQRAPQQVSSEELVAFTWWFYSGVFDEGLSLDLFEKSLESADRLPDNPYMVVSRLAQLADSYPEPAVSLLCRIAESEEGSWALRSNKEATARILRAGLASEAESMALELRDRLGRQGMMELRELRAPNKNSG